jgi:hypothetical protein
MYCPPVLPAAIESSKSKLQEARRTSPYLKTTITTSSDSRRHSACESLSAALTTTKNNADSKTDRGAAEQSDNDNTAYIYIAFITSKRNNYKRNNYKRNNHHNATTITTQQTTL